MALSLDLSMPRSKGMVIGFWIVTALFFDLGAGGVYHLAQVLDDRLGEDGSPELTSTWCFMPAIRWSGATRRQSPES